MVEAMQLQLAVSQNLSAALKDVRSPRCHGSPPLLAMESQPQKFVDALTIKLGSLSEKAISTSDLQSNGIRPLMLTQLHSKLLRDDDVREGEEEKNKILADWGIDVDGKIQIPSSKTLQDILALESRPKGWEELNYEHAIWLQSKMENSANPIFSLLTFVNYYDVASAMCMNFQDILPPRLLELLWHISLDDEWIHWPNELQARRILNDIVYDNALFSTVLLRTLSDTSRHHV
ncbi:hypothetical protein E1B28_012704 [Marasmius oreades]|uniref:Uncharacterized protein n=1 Tax=Marasmius oreades TaxID=181124 RepID=A0A9P7RS09_9AGAR|nr:uncharacterized protein E1B28_012704 [Marasmius oreades]KAG7088736.1 hypothetical protein E1B28_012704 [Marasmius oreades]